jgi:hypothetical protein
MYVFKLHLQTGDAMVAKTQVDRPNLWGLYTNCRYGAKLLHVGTDATRRSCMEQECLRISTRWL